MVRRQQWTCRLAFFALGVLPLVGVCGGMAYRNITHSTAHWCDIVQSRFGLRAEIEHVVSPRPGELRFEGVTLMHPETGELAVRCDSVVMSRVADELRLSIPSTTVHSAHWSMLRRALFDRFMKQPLLIEEPVRVAIAELAFTGPVSRKRAEEVDLHLWRSAKMTESTIEFRWAGQPTSDRVTIHVVRRLPYATVPTWIEVRTGELSLPCDLIVGTDNPLSSRLAGVHFQGYVWVEPSPAGWNAEFRGNLEPIDLQLWIEQPFGRNWSGTARAEGVQLRVMDGVVTDLVASIQCAVGQISGALLESAAEHLDAEIHWPQWDVENTTAGVSPEERTAPWEYEQLGLHVELNASGLRLTGISSDQGPGYGTAMKLLPNGFCRIATPADERLSAGALVKALVPGSAPQVPIHAAAKPLLFALPWESSGAP